MGEQGEDNLATWTQRGKRKLSANLRSNARWGIGAVGGHGPTRQGVAHNLRRVRSTLRGRGWSVKGRQAHKPFGKGGGGLGAPRSKPGTKVWGIRTGKVGPQVSSFTMRRPRTAKQKQASRLNIRRAKLKRAIRR